LAITLLVASLAAAFVSPGGSALAQTAPAQPAGAPSVIEPNRLAHPEVAEKLGLSDTQRAEVQRLLQERTAALQETDEAAQTVKIAEIDAAIRAALTDTQWEQWQSTPPANLLEFRFREQPWADVLQWFAQQEGLTLIMDRTPPGTFTYQDSRQYTSAQAIDLLNSVLMTRGFTLIRREKMLTLMQVSDAIPIELIPEVKLEDLPSRGRFELVRVKFPLGGRPVEEVMKGVTPYLGNLGRAVPLAQSRQLVVIETAGKMETINLLIQSVPEPKAPEQPKPPEKPPEPVFAAYSLGDLDPAATLEAITTLVGSERIMVDGQTRVLHAYVVPGQQVAIQSAIEKLIESATAKTPDRSVAYKLRDANPTIVQTQLAAIAPLAVISVDTVGNRILVTATPADQAKIADALKALGTSADDDATLIGDLKVYELSTEGLALWTQLQTAITAKMEDVDVAVKPATTDKPAQVMVWASASDHEKIEQWITQIRDITPKPPVAWPRAYPLEGADPTLAGDLLAKQFPAVRVTTAEDGLTVWADAETHDAIAQWIAVVADDLPKPTERPMKPYRVAGMTPTELQTVLAPMIAGDPTTTVTLDTPRGRLLIAATDSVHAKIEELIAQLAAPPAADLQKVLIAYSLEHADAADLQTVITAAVPGATIVTDSQGKQLIVTATLQDQGKIKAIIDEIDRPASASGTKELRRYPMENVPAATLVTTLQTLLPRMTFTAEPTTNQILATGTVAEHQSLRDTLDRLTESDAAGAKSVKSFAVPVGDFRTLPAVLAQLVPEAVISADELNRALLVWGTADHHGRVEQAIEQLTASAGEREQVMVFTLPADQVVATQTALITLFPTVRVAIDPVSGRITLLTPKSLAEQVDEFMQKRLADQEIPEPRVYQVRDAIRPTFTSMLPTVVPRATLAAAGPNAALSTAGISPWRLRFMQSVAGGGLPGTTPTSTPADRVVVIATPSDHDRIDTLLKQLDDQFGDVEPTVTRPYLLVKTAPAAFTTLIAERRPQARLLTVPDPRRPVVTDTESGHVEIAKMIEELESAFEGAGEKVLKVYEVREDLFTQASTGLATILPAATLLPQSLGTRLSVLATAEDHTRLSQWLVELEQSVPEPQSKLSRVYTLRVGDPLAAVRLIQALIPTATLAGDPLTRSVAATANEAEHERIAELVKQFDQPSDNPVQTRVFVLGTGSARELSLAVTQMLPTARVTAETASNSLIVSATAEQLDAVTEMIRGVEEGGGDVRETRTYVLTRASPLSFQQALTTMYPRATIAADSLSGGLIVAASPDQHVEIEAMVSELNESSIRSELLKIYKLQHADPEDVADALQQAFGRRSTAGVTADVNSRSVFVVGMADQQEIAAELITQLDQASTSRDPRVLRAFSMAGISGRELSESIESLFSDSRPKVDVRFDVFNEQLVVIATEEQLTQVEQTISQFKPADRTLEVFTLRANEPSSVEDAISSIFSDLPFSAAPSVLVDEGRQQLIVRATVEQFVEIRELLRRLGESPQADIGGTGSVVTPGARRVGNRMRTIAVGRDSDSILRQLQQAWPSMLDNPLRVIGPGTLQRGEPDQPTHEAFPLPDPAPSPTPAPVTPPSAEPSADAPQPSPNAGAGINVDDTAFTTVALTPSEPQQPPGEPIADPPAGRTAPPVIVIPGPDSWTIASEDPDALDLLAQWIEAATREASVEGIEVGRNSSIFVMRHANASELATVITNLFRQNSSNRSTNRDNETRIVADPRINALIVRGSFSDRNAIQELLAVLDSPQFIGSFESPPPVYVPIENAEASRIEQILRSVYAAQLSRGGGRPPITIPAGVSTVIASMLEQINASASGPLLTLSVDEVSNAIVMRAPPELAREVTEFIKQVDTQASVSRSRGVRVVPLTQSNADQILQAIESIRADSPRRGRGR
jgi:type II secretory pathway component GspD/PulD (secretin)